MSHEGDGGRIEIEVSFAAEEGGVVGRGEYEGLRAEVVGRCGLGSGKAERLGLTVEGHDKSGVLPDYHTGLERAPKCTAEVPFGYMRDVECLVAEEGGRVLGMERAVVLGPMGAHLPKDLQRRVFRRRDDHLCQRSCFLPEGDLQSCHGTGVNVEALCEISDGGENELRLRLHVHAEGIIAVGVGGSADLRAAEMNIDIRDGFACRLVDDLADDDGLDRVERQNAR